MNQREALVRYGKTIAWAIYFRQESHEAAGNWRNLARGMMRSNALNAVYYAGLVLPKNKPAALTLTSEPQVDRIRESLTHPANEAKTSSGPKPC